MDKAAAAAPLLQLVTIDQIGEMAPSCYRTAPAP